MTTATPFTADQEAVWRSLLRIVISMPRILDEDLMRESGLSLTEYGVLMYLSEAPDRQLRMSELATLTGLSPSRITRLVETLRKAGLVRKERCVGDARGNVTTLTEDGFARLRAAYPAHLRSARRTVIDHLNATEIATMAVALQRIAAASGDLADRVRRPAEHPAAGQREPLRHLEL